MVMSKKVLRSLGEVRMEASTARISSKGRVVIPASVRRAASLKKGDKILVIAIGGTIFLKRISDMSFEEAVKPVWNRVRRMGLSEEDLTSFIEEARIQSDS